MTTGLKLVSGANTRERILEKLRQIKWRLEFDEDAVEFMPEPVRLDVINMIARWQYHVVRAQPEDLEAVTKAVAEEARLVIDALKAASDQVAAALTAHTRAPVVLH